MSLEKNIERIADALELIAEGAVNGSMEGGVLTEGETSASDRPKATRKEGKKTPEEKKAAAAAKRAAKRVPMSRGICIAAKSSTTIAADSSSHKNAAADARAPQATSFGTATPSRPTRLDVTFHSNPENTAAANAQPAQT